MCNAQGLAMFSSSLNQCGDSIDAVDRASTRSKSALFLRRSSSSWSLTLAKRMRAKSFPGTDRRVMPL